MTVGAAAAGTGKKELVKPPAHVEPVGQNLLVEGFYCSGEEIAHFETIKPMECRHKCDQNAKCKGFTVRTEVAAEKSDG